MKKSHSMESPHRPKLLGEIVTVPLEDGVLIDGFARLEVIRGPIAQTLLPSLLDLMDGTHTVDELQASFPSVPPEYIHDAVSYLVAGGIVSDVIATDVVPEANADTMAFLRRIIGSSRLDCSASECYVRLLDTPVHLFSGTQSGRVADILQILLQDSGVRNVQIIQEPRFLDRSSSAGVLVILNPEEALDVMPVKWFRAAWNQESRQADLGPSFDLQNGDCWHCFKSTHIGSKPALGLIQESDEAIFAALVALEIVQAMALPQLALTGRAFRQVQLDDLSSRICQYPRLPGCPHCGPKKLLPLADFSERQPRHLSLVDTAMVFENYVGVESRTELDRGPHDRFGTKAPNLIEGGLFLNCEQFSLGTRPLILNTSATDVGPLEKGGSSNNFSIDDLGAILAMTAGLREKSDNGNVRRWAPTAGNLGSVELFVVARNVDGLRPGFYFYIPDNHSLAAFRKRNAGDLRQFMRRCVGRVEGELPDALVVFNGALHKVFSKYSAFGYKLIHLDAGAALSQLHYVAKGMMVWVRTVPKWADFLIDHEFNLDPGTEQCTAVVEISRRRPRAGHVGFFHKKRSARETPTSWRQPGSFQGQGMPEVMERLQQESRLTEAQVLAAPDDAVADFPKDHNSFSYMQLPTAAQPHFPLGHVFSVRRSIREYDAKPVPAHYLHAMLRTAHEGDSCDWADEVRCNNDLKLFVLARSVSDLASGVYVCRSDGAALSFHKELPAEEKAVELFAQPAFAKAPLFVWITGNLALTCARHGAFGHRQLLLRAGSAGHRLWTTGISLGLAGCLVAGVVVGAARNNLGMDGYEDLSLLGFAAGYPVEQAPV